MQLLLSVLGTLAGLVAVAIQVEDWFKKRRAERAALRKESLAPSSSSSSGGGQPPTLTAPPPANYSPTSAQPVTQQTESVQTTRRPPALPSDPPPRTQSGRLLMDRQAARAAALDASVARRWVGPWVWAAVQALVVVNAVMIAVDLQGWVDLFDAQFTQQQVRNVATNGVIYSLVAAAVSAFLPLGRVRSRNPVTVPYGQGTLTTFMEGPRLLHVSRRGRIYAAYVPLDVTVAGTVIVVHHRTVGADLLDQLSNWWTVAGLVVILLLVIMETGDDVMGWLRSRRLRR